MQEQGGSRGSFFLNVNVVFLSQIDEPITSGAMHTPRIRA